MKKDKNIAAVLALVLGVIGVHRFYLGQNGLGVLYIFLTFIGVSPILAIIDFLVFITMRSEVFDLKYNDAILSNNTFNSRNYQEEEEFRTTTVSQPTPDKKKELLDKLQGLSKNIKETLKNSDHYTKEVIRDITPIMDKYMKQVEDLLERDEKLERILSNNSIKELSMNIAELQSKLDTVRSEKLKHEYNKAIERHKKRKNSMQEFREQRKIIKFRLQEIEMSFEQIEYDLVRLENLNDEEQRKELNKMFKDRSDDLANYLDALKSTYKNI